ncbi:MAG: DUF91 domain-containing protein [Candidatus Bathyarchaeota archaeon]|nr:MAG: DUF91 domain-containing protein [Candidatus Bathyarchaeota archaeon]
MDAYPEYTFLVFKSERKMYEFILYFETGSPYEKETKRIIRFLEKIRKKWNADFDLNHVETLSETQVERVKDDIRKISPQIRGKIVSSKGKILPLSNNKNLNTQNTPILLIYDNQTPINVYPHMLGTAYFEIGATLENILKDGLKAHMIAKGILEEPVQKILADDPWILGQGMKFIAADKDVDFGVVDVILEDENGRMVIVEIETEATETAVAQVSRLAAGYASQNKSSLDHLRKVIVCLNFNARAAKACRGANVELFQLAMQKIC